jgi:hypothetical protein
MKNPHLLWRAVHELALADPDFGSWDNLLVRRIRKMPLKTFLRHPFTDEEMRLLKSLFCCSLHVYMHTCHASKLPTSTEIVNWVKKPIRSLHLSVYVEWYLLKCAVDAGNEEAKRLLREHLLQHSSKRKQL